MVRWEEEGGLDRLFRSPAYRAAGRSHLQPCYHTRAASSARARHSRASMWLSGCNARCRSPPFEDAWAVLAATLGVSDAALGCATKAARTAPMAKRRVRYPIAPISVSVVVKIAGYYSLLGLHDPTVHPPSEPRACPLYQLDLRRGHLRSEPALPVVVVEGAAAFVALRLLLSVAMLCHGVPTMHHRA